MSGAFACCRALSGESHRLSCSIHGLVALAVVAMGNAQRRGQLPTSWAIPCRFTLNLRRPNIAERPVFVGLFNYAETTEGIKYVIPVVCIRVKAEVSRLQTPLRRLPGLPWEISKSNLAVVKITDDVYAASTLECFGAQSSSRRIHALIQALLLPIEICMHIATRETPFHCFLE